MRSLSLLALALAGCFEAELDDWPPDDHGCTAELAQHVWDVPARPANGELGFGVGAAFVPLAVTDEVELEVGPGGQWVIYVDLRVRFLDDTAARPCMTYGGGVTRVERIDDAYFAVEPIVHVFSYDLPGLLAGTASTDPLEGGGLIELDGTDAQMAYLAPRPVLVNREGLFGTGDQ
jgi:hypothetical protein